MQESVSLFRVNNLAPVDGRKVQNKYFATILAVLLLLYYSSQNYFDCCLLLLASWTDATYYFKLIFIVSDLLAYLIDCHFHMIEQFKQKLNTSHKSNINVSVCTQL